MTAESWCGRAAGIDGPTWVMATYKIADCTRYIPYPIRHNHAEGFGVGFHPHERVVSLSCSCSLDSIDSGSLVSWLFYLRDISEWLA